jgi:hypothetical protein
MKQTIKTELKRFAILLLIDILLIGGWVICHDSNSLVMFISTLPVPFVINLFIIPFMYLIKKEYVYMIFVNAFITPIMFSLFWMWNIEIQRHLFMEEWLFDVNGQEYSISYHTNDNEEKMFWLYRLDAVGSWSEDRGTFSLRKDTVFFNSIDSATIYYIYKDYLYDFISPYDLRRKRTDIHQMIKVKKRY